MAQEQQTVLISHPSPDLYGSDLQLVETISGFVAAGWRVIVALPEDGPLVSLLQDRGAEVQTGSFPVLRKAFLHPQRILGFIWQHLRALQKIRSLIRTLRPTVVWANTLTIPVWLAAARLTGTRAVVHVHEAEEEGPRLVLKALASQIRLAEVGVVNSRAAARAITRVTPTLGSRLKLVYNGVPEPELEPAPPTPDSRPSRVALVGRLSPRKGTDVAVDAMAHLRASGYDVHLDLYGAVFPGYEWFEEQLKTRVQDEGLGEVVSFHGYVRPVWDALAASQIVIVPSRLEPFGNVAVEAQLALRPVVVAAVQGLTEIVTDGVDGLHVVSGSAQDLARALQELLDHPDQATRLARAGRDNALSRFTVERYQEEIARVLEDVAQGP